MIRPSVHEDFGVFVPLEFALASCIFFSVALARVSQRTIIAAGQILGFVQILAGMVAAAVLPAYTVYMLQFHPAWTLGLAADSRLLPLIQLNGLWMALGLASLLVIVAAATYLLAVTLLRSDHPGRVWWPGFAGLFLLVLPLLRGFDGARSLDGQWPPGWIAGIVIIIILSVTIYFVHRADLGVEVQ